MDNIEQQVEEFLTHISIEKNYSQATVNTYRIALSILCPSGKCAWRIFRAEVA